jgi:hypothetical protein
MVGTAEKAKAESEVRGRELVVKVGGVWRLGEDTPAWDAVVGEHTPERVRIDDDGLRVWDSSLPSSSSGRGGGRTRSASPSTTPPCPPTCEGSSRGSGPKGPAAGDKSSRARP